MNTDERKLQAKTRIEFYRKKYTQAYTQKSEEKKHKFVSFCFTMRDVVHSMVNENLNHLHDWNHPVLEQVPV